MCVEFFYGNELLVIAHIEQVPRVGDHFMFEKDSYRVISTVWKLVKFDPLDRYCVKVYLER